ncbi:MAG: 50S ribosomal protein L12 [Thermoproteota archaeon]|nr:50S ribosomal protein P1 [Candidatus Brockarchaeota archaeon]MBO3762844.1 50S ribosomal protein P1 [Candidatus Brockarchaeota archaeon]MBO3768405.1 50S ribosomal protein P1 [Candidatus Brockarchaeota archaeon]MBO3801510.1 50S ribosomal protein P1 [Candidatus Brockarchaeota archaeon]
MSEYIHAVLLLHSVKKEINEENLANVIKAAGSEPDMQRVKMVVSALSNVDIDKVLSSATVSFLSAPATGVTPTTTQVSQKAEEKPKEEKKEEKAEEVAGLGALFE